MTNHERRLKELIAQHEGKIKSLEAEIKLLKAAIEVNKNTNPKDCLGCGSHWFGDDIDRRIFHNNGHVWPGFAGEPC